MRSFPILLKRGVIFMHWWIGIALCLLFAMWFTSGIVMMYSDFPAVRPEDRLDRSQRLDPSQIRVSPMEALAKTGIARALTQIRLVMFDGRPLYILGGGRGARRVFADSGESPAAATLVLAARVASAWTALPAAAAAIESIGESDQWTVQGPLRNERPLWKFSWPNGEQVYVSGVTGEVAQYTTTASRFWAYLGAIPHWLYFTPLRRHQVGWTRTVIWTSGAGTMVALLGMVIGLWMSRFTGIPYRGQKRWHLVLGLTFGLAAATWAFSGMLSMDPFPTRERRASGSRKIDDALRARLEVSAFDDKPPREALTELAGLDIKELELVSVAGEPAYLATIQPANTRIVPVHGSQMREFGFERIVRVVQTAIGAGAIAEIRQIDSYDAFYLDRRRRRPLPVVLVKLNDTDKTRYYIDPKTGRIAGNYSSRSWVTRWLYHGLHSFDFPWLYDHRPLWDVVVITLLSGGVALSVTSILLSWRVLRRKLSQVSDVY
jgi:hypothetical protein